MNTLPTNGLVAYYPFNGNANDESGNSHNGTVYGATLTTDRHNKVNSAYEFNGINNYINAFFTFDYPARTVSLWVYAYEIHAAYPNQGAIVVQDNPSLTHGSLAASYDNGILKVNAGGSNDIYQTSQNVENRWYHFALVRDGSTARYYINGELKYTGAADVLHSTTSASSNLLFGVGRSLTSQFFSGKLDDIAVYNRALNASEINTLYGVK